MAPPAYGAFHVAQNAFVAQSVERVLGKDEVSSSILDKGSSENQASAEKFAEAFLISWDNVPPQREKRRGRRIRLRRIPRMRKAR